MPKKKYHFVLYKFKKLILYLHIVKTKNYLTKPFFV